MIQTASLLHCPQCGEFHPIATLNSEQWGSCGGCRKKFQAWVFPAILRPPDTHTAGSALLQAEDASCFYHAGKKAEAVCESCGVFLCGLCDIPMNDRHLCVRCIEKGHSKGKMQNLQTQRILYDDMALGLTILPMLLVWATILTAPIALFLAIWHWKSPSSIVPRTKIRLILAILFSLIQIFVWTLVFWKMAH